MRSVRSISPTRDNSLHADPDLDGRLHPASLPREATQIARLERGS